MTAYWRCLPSATLHPFITISSALNLAYKQWGTVFPGAACVAALVDRFAQHCHLVDIDADSWRHKEATERAASKYPKKSH